MWVTGVQTCALPIFFAPSLVAMCREPIVILFSMYINKRFLRNRFSIFFNFFHDYSMLASWCAPNQIPEKLVVGSLAAWPASRFDGRILREMRSYREEKMHIESAAGR